MCVCYTRRLGKDAFDVGAVTSSEEEALDEEDDDDGDGGMATGVLGLIVGGSLVGAVALLVGGYVVFSMRGRRDAFAKKAAPINTEEVSMYTDNPSLLPASQPHFQTKL